MKRLIFLLITVLATVLAGITLAATSALADSPHFLYANNSITSKGARSTSFKDAGLGTGVTSVAITLTADATATYQCYNKAGNKPEGVPKSFGPTGVTTKGNFTVNHGQTTGTLEAGPLGPGNFSCPSGQIRFLDGVSYSHTFVSDETLPPGNTFHATPDPVSATLHIQV